MKQNPFLIHYWQLPKELYVGLKEDFHKELCSIIQEKTNCKYKHCFHIILKCSKWKAKSLFNKKNRFTIKDLEKLRKFTKISKQDVEKNLETLGNQEHGAIIGNPKLPFHMKDIFYVASHLMFDGCFRPKHGCYFYTYEESLTNYHRKRLNNFGEVPINLIEKENQLYFPYTIGYIISKFLEMESFKSKTCVLSEKSKSLAKKYKILTDEIVKALIIDEGSIGDKITIELANQKLVENLYDIISGHYELNKLFSRERHNISFKGNSWNHNLTAWGFAFSAKSFQKLYKSISLLPIPYKQENLSFLYLCQTKSWNQRKFGETKKLIVLSLLKKPKTMEELAKELLVKQTTIRSHLKGHPTFRDSLIKLGIVEKIEERILRRGGFARVGIYGIKDINKAKNFINY